VLWRSLSAPNHPSRACLVILGRTVTATQGAGWQIPHSPHGGSSAPPPVSNRDFKPDRAMPAGSPSNLAGLQEQAALQHDTPELHAFGCHGTQRIVLVSLYPACVPTTLFRTHRCSHEDFPLVPRNVPGGYVSQEACRERCSPRWLGRSGLRRLRGHWRWGNRQKQGQENSCSQELYRKAQRTPASPALTWDLSHAIGSVLG